MVGQACLAHVFKLKCIEWGCVLNIADVLAAPDDFMLQWTGIAKQLSYLKASRGTA